MGIRHQKLGELLREMGYQNDTGFTVCEEIFSIIMKFKDSGKTYMEIAKLTGLHPKRVEYIINTNNKQSKNLYRKAEMLLYNMGLYLVSTGH